MIVLSFNLPEVARETLTGLCEGLRIIHRAVTPSDRALPLGALAGLPMYAPSPKEAGETFTEPMLVMCHFDQETFDAFLRVLRQSLIPRIDLKAVLTPTNAAWTSLQLYTELCRERDHFRNKGQMG